MMRPTLSVALLLIGTAEAQTTLYGVDVRLDGFYTTDTGDFVGNLTVIGPHTGSVFAIDFNETATTLWGIDDTTLDYGTFDLATGTFTQVGFLTGIAGATGLTCDANGTWFLSEFDGTNSNLYSGDVTAGTFSLVGTIGAGIMIDISIDSQGNLYGHNISDDSLYSIDTSTGAGTLIGGTGQAANFAQGMDFDWSDDTLYATIYTGGGTGVFASFDLSTGFANVIQSTTSTNREMEVACQSGVPGLTIGAGSDFWNTPGLGCTYQDFSASPIPAGFFGPGSQPFSGYVAFVGDPLMGTGLAGGVDTIVERLQDAQLAGCPSSDTVPLRIVALSLKSFQPITVQFASSTSKYRVQACLSSTFAQPTGSMTIRREHVIGGTFESIVPVVPRLVFTKVSGAAGVASAVLDAGNTITFENPPSSSGIPGCWGLTDGGLGIPSSPGGLVDHDCNVSTPNVPYPPTTSNFFGGVCFPGADCNQGGGPAEPMLVEESALLARHCVLPIALPPGNLAYCMCPVDQPAYPPCGNPDPDAGCMNSTGSGALLTYSGVADVDNDTLVLEVGSVPNQPGIFFQGTAPVLGQFGAGHRCVGGAVIRFPVQFPSGNMVVSNVSIAAHGGIPPGGGVRYYQFWYRDPAGCSTFNLSNALQIEWIP